MQMLKLRLGRKIFNAIAQFISGTVKSTHSRIVVNINGSVCRGDR
jgi:hypothetical protein